MGTRPVPTRSVSKSVEPAPFRRALLSWYFDQDRPLPWRLHWQKTKDPYGVWVSEIMLQQTLIAAVIPVYLRFMELFPTARDLAKASEDEVRSAVRGLGYYRRFGFLHKGVKEIVAQSGRGDLTWPRSYHVWLELPGIGPYTAAAISSICFNAPHGVIDGNVERVFCRLFDWQEPVGTPLLKSKLQPIVNELLDPVAAGDFNQAIMEIGQLVCTKNSPACDVCPLSKWCLAKAKSSQNLAPAPKVRPEAISVHMQFAIIARPSRAARGDIFRSNPAVEFLLVKRDQRHRFLKDSIGFPELSELQLPTPLLELGDFSHSITKHKITGSVFHGNDMASEHSMNFGLEDRGSWVHMDSVEPLLIANLDRKAWHLFERYKSSSGKNKRQTRLGGLPPVALFP